LVFNNPDYAFEIVVAKKALNTPSLGLGTFNVMQMTAGISFHALRSFEA